MVDYNKADSKYWALAFFFTLPVTEMSCRGIFDLGNSSYLVFSLNGAAQFRICKSLG